MENSTSKSRLSYSTATVSKLSYPGEFLFSSRFDKVIDIIETWRVISTLHHMSDVIYYTSAKENAKATYPQQKQ